MKNSLMLSTIFFAFLASAGHATQEPNLLDRPATNPCDQAFLNSAPSGTYCNLDQDGFLVALVRPQAGSTQFPPIVYFLGGPGGFVAAQVPRLQQLSNELGHPILIPAVADHISSIDCESPSSADAIWGLGKTPGEAKIYRRQQSQNKLQSCLSQINVQTALISKIGTKAVAESMMHLRQMLGISSWGVIGESYGARLALALNRIDGAAISRMVFDSPETPWVDSFWHNGRHFIEALKRLEAKCRSDYYCPGKRVRLERRLLEAISTHDPSTIEPIPLVNVNTGAVDAYSRPTAEQLLISTFHALRAPSRAILLPYIAVAPSSRAVIDRYGLLLDSLLYPSDSLNAGMHHLVRCRELPLDRWYAALKQDSAEYPKVEQLLDYISWRQQFMCRGLNISAPDRVESLGSVSAPLLVLSGSIDPITPPTVVREALAGLPGAIFRTYEMLGHVTNAQNPCVRRDIRDFLNGQQAGPESRTSCKGSDLKVRFYSPVVIR